MTKSLALLAVAVCIAANGTRANGGLIQGQAKDLSALNVGNVTMDFFSAQGAFLGQTSSASGFYSIPVSSPPGNQAIVVVFSSPGRTPASLTVSTATNNFVDVVLPVQTQQQMYFDHRAQRRCCFRLFGR